MTRASEQAVAAVRQLAPYLPGKPTSELERELGLTQIVKLASNENPLGPSPLAQLALQRALADTWIYPDGSGHELKLALAQRLGLAPPRITLGNGSNDLLVMLAESFLAPGRNAVMSQYCFAVYPIVTAATGAEARVVPALPANHPTMPLGHDLGAMADAVDANTRLVFIANPNNPTGTWVPRDDLRRFVAALPETCLVVLDEAYFEYAQAHGGSDGVEWLDDFEHLVVLRTFSKAYGLAGLRVGYGLAHADVAAILERVRQPFNVSSLALAAAHAALQDRNHLARSVALVDDGRELLRRGLGDLRWPALPSAGNFLLVEFGDMAAQYYQELLRAGLIVRPVANYQLPRHLRITIGTAAQNARLLAALGALCR